MADIRTLKKRLEALRKKKAQAMKQLAPKKKRGRPPGSKNKLGTKDRDSAAQPRRRAKFRQESNAKRRGRPRIHAIQKHVYPDYEGVSLVVRKTERDYRREWCACLDNNVIGYYKNIEDARKAYANENSKTN
jgi:hypothetical protein